MDFLHCIFCKKIFTFHANIPKLSEPVHSSWPYPQKIMLITFKLSTRTNYLKNNLQIYVFSESFIFNTGTVRLKLFRFKK
jgi:hypothetical protein